MGLIYPGTYNRGAYIWGAYNWGLISGVYVRAYIRGGFYPGGL